MSIGIGHKVVIQETLFWRFKRYRYACATCHQRGRWYKSKIVPREQGWYHDDVTLFEMLTKQHGAKSS